MAGKVRTWVWVVVAIGVVGILGLLAVVGGALFYMSRNVESKPATSDSATAEFAAARAEFSGQRPLIELDAKGNVLRADTGRKPSGAAPPPAKLYLLAFNPSEGRIVRFSLPFWLLRLKTGDATIDLNGNRMDLEDLRLSVQDLEREGSALILDHQTAEGERVLVWSK